ncbi:SMP-30/gluconolactonase/LRE family protein [Shewanella sp. 1_MG-2023]|uniref:SMP-30/gluconolactonase/LRE family protein n=1 Tax=unclassified Shewanella TaxID=196818 RepID=UPI0026E4430E|nr:MULTISPECIES: SMP-30/gluconolactonase/LRE family protein [unclassified Shewanella]MDO6613411.1 SMP-30/gluconolactonase/LRE family protein [Shewanella sp. 7_MG-2023]MDO6770077.1 SMP-30/gluconolactonase/LRE family protein [Shewanella sp. 2_MG-2023]MDO6794811.1 SMP-30/gluconolactonase/LRE family protein [Shewanella sp. 1_MG-2023]
MSSQVFDSRVNYVGESPLWHPLTDTLYWVDFPNKQLMSRKGEQTSQHTFDQMVTAIGWVDQNHLVIATETGLYRFNLDTKQTQLIVHVEHQVSSNRSNDGRADPWGGFWIGTMDNDATPNKGCFYRYYQGQLKTIITDLTIPNGMCFDKSRQRAYYADSAAQKMYWISLDAVTGWPVDEFSDSELRRRDARLFFDFSDSAVSPDGAIVDAEGNVWVSLWDGGCIVCLSPEGKELERVDTGTSRPTCPAFGGELADKLFTTSAQCGLEEAPVTANIHGTTILLDTKVKGLFEPAVNLTE